MSRWDDLLNPIPLEPAEATREWAQGGLHEDDWDLGRMNNIAWGPLPEFERILEEDRLHPPAPARDNLPAGAITFPLPRSTSPAQQPLPNHLYPLWGTISDDDEDQDTQQSQQPSPTPSDPASAEFVTLEDTTDEEDADMPANERPRRNTTRRSSVVDLTSNPSPEENSQNRGTKRRASGDSGGGRAVKRRMSRVKDEEIEQLDLTGDADEQLLQQQQKSAIKAQQEDQDQGPQKIGQRQCIICMENYTNATATACGHFYCHECLVRAIMASERNSERGGGTCPVCRKPIKRNRKADIIPISFMKKSQFAKNQAKRTDL